MSTGAGATVRLATAQAATKLSVGREPDSYFGSCQVAAGSLATPRRCAMKDGDDWVAHFVGALIAAAGKTLFSRL
jgi:hypothetical protein